MTVKLADSAASQLHLADSWQHMGDKSMPSWELGALCLCSRDC